ncbi:MAG: phytanoyl-CoA dioxygenase family protein [Sphingobium sp.]
MTTTTESPALSAEALKRTAADFARDGAVYIPQMLTAGEMDIIEEVFQFAADNPGPHAFDKPTTEKFVYVDNGLVHLWKEAPYQRLFSIPAFGKVTSALFSEPDIWFINEQVTWKQGGSKRTPFHQDTRYFNYDGPDQVQYWISLGSLDQKNSLEFIKGSHKGPVYGHIDDSETRLGEKPPMPPLHGRPIHENIEANRDAYEILSWPIARGDVLAFHPTTIHGGAPDKSDLSRRSLTLRCCGKKTVRVPTPEAMKEGIGDHGIYGELEKMPLGTPVCELDLPVRIWPL